jgi:hypothetical protein
MSGGAGPVVPRAGRRRSLLAGAIGIAVLAALPFASGLFSRDEGPSAGAPGRVPGGPTGGLDVGPVLHGRLVYVAPDGDTGEARLWIVDLARGSLTAGPAAPDLRQVSAAGVERDRLVLVSGEEGSVVASVLDPSDGAAPAEIARGDLIGLSTDGDAVLVADVTPGTGCPGRPAYDLHIVPLEPGSAGHGYEGWKPCGDLLSVGLAGRTPVLSYLRNGRPSVRLLVRDELRIEVGFDGLAHVAASGSGRLLLVEPGRGGLASGSVVGPVLVWPGGGAPRPLVTGAELVARRILAWSSDGRAVVVDGRLEGEAGTWIVDVAAGDAEPLPTLGDARRLAPSAAAFDDEGTLFAVEEGRVIVVGRSGVFPLDLPAGAPPPSGPVAWLH